MKLLVVSPVPSDPPTAGNRARVAALFAALVHLGHDVTFAYVPFETADYQKMRVRLGDRLAVMSCAMLVATSQAVLIRVSLAKL